MTARPKMPVHARRPGQHLMARSRPLPCQLDRRRACNVSASAGRPSTYIGSLSSQGLKFGIVAARFNELVTKPLLEGVLEGLERHGTQREAVDVGNPSRYSPEPDMMPAQSHWNGMVCPHEQLDQGQRCNAIDASGWSEHRKHLKHPFHCDAGRLGPRQF